MTNMVYGLETENRGREEEEEEDEKGKNKTEMLKGPGVDYIAHIQ